ncbi:MAG: hypothetical protein ACE5JR_08035 [Gemmatimonadota bacterium]
MRFLLLLILIACGFYAVVALSLYGSTSPCEMLREEIAEMSVVAAEQRSIDRAGAGLRQKERDAVRERARRTAEARIRARELTPLPCLRKLWTLKRQGPEAAGVRDLLPDEVP